MHTILLVSLLTLSGCAAEKPIIKPPPPPTVSGTEWEPFHQREMAMSAFDGGAAVNEPGRRHVLTRLSKAEISAEDRLIAWRKYCHHRIDMTAADWAALQGDTKPKEIEICRSDDIKK